MPLFELQIISYKCIGENQIHLPVDIAPAVLRIHHLVKFLHGSPCFLSLPHSGEIQNQSIHPFSTHLFAGAFLWTGLLSAQPACAIAKASCSVVGALLDEGCITFTWPVGKGEAVPEKEEGAMLVIRDKMGKKGTAEWRLYPAGDDRPPVSLEPACNYPNPFNPVTTIMYPLPEVTEERQTRY